MYKKFIKRVLDFSLALLAIIILSPVYIIISILVVIFMGWPILFKQPRPGKNEKIFNMYKFRTMTNKKDKDGNLKYTNVKVSQFTYHGEPANQESTISGSGNGRLFPTLYTLYHQEVSSRISVSGHTIFVNTSEISKRNGRVYHYTFPDGAIPPRLTFLLDTEKEGTTGKYNVTFDMSNLKDGFIPARWYKINVKISGIELSKEEQA